MLAWNDATCKDGKNANMRKVAFQVSTLTEQRHEYATNIQKGPTITASM